MNVNKTFSYLLAGAMTAGYGCGKKASQELEVINNKAVVSVLKENFRVSADTSKIKSAFYQSNAGILPDKKLQINYIPDTTYDDLGNKVVSKKTEIYRGGAVLTVDSTQKVTPYETVFANSYQKMVSGAPEGVNEVKTIPQGSFKDTTALLLEDSQDTVANTVYSAVERIKPNAFGTQSRGFNISVHDFTEKLNALKKEFGL